MDTYLFYYFDAFLVHLLKVYHQPTPLIAQIEIPKKEGQNAKHIQLLLKLMADIKVIIPFVDALEHNPIYTKFLDKFV